MGLSLGREQGFRWRRRLAARWWRDSAHVKAERRVMPRLTQRQGSEMTPVTLVSSLVDLGGVWADWEFQKRQQQK
jgi:hypothetical protein